MWAENVDMNGFSIAYKFFVFGSLRVEDNHGRGLTHNYPMLTV